MSDGKPGKAGKSESGEVPAKATRRSFIRNDGFDPDRVVGGGRPETPDKNMIPELLRQWKAYKKSGYVDPPGYEANAMLIAGTAELVCWWATIEKLSAEGFNLAASRYKPQVAEKLPEEDPVELIREILELEKDITKGLEKLLAEIKPVEAKKA
ncbi:hypothetical protein IT570_05180 [Candidatus Sumerlaeota bacterium]|nr:hypothetical protein [Candidatus Sumerlaeota bacterium]